MGRFFNIRQEVDEAIDAGVDTNQPIEQMAGIASGMAGEPVALLLALALAAKHLEDNFGGGTGNEAHDIITAGGMREPLAKLNLAIAEVVEATKDVTWQAEICTCSNCRKGDRARASKYN